MILVDELSLRHSCNNDTICEKIMHMFMSSTQHIFQYVYIITIWTNLIHFLIHAVTKLQQVELVLEDLQKAFNLFY